MLYSNAPLSSLTHASYGGMSGHVHRQMQDQLSVAHFVAGPRSQELRCSRAHCASGVVLRFSISVPCLSQSHRTSPLTSISARRRRRRGPDLARGWMASMAQGARGCGWSKHESGPHRHSLQLLCLHQVPPRATSRGRVRPRVKRPSQREARQTAAVSRCVSELHEKSIGSSRSMYLLPGNPSSHAVEAYRDSGEARCAKSLHTATPPFSGDDVHTSAQSSEEQEGG